LLRRVVRLDLSRFNEFRDELPRANFAL
jgi:hypothetical protein